MIKSKFRYFKKELYSSNLDYTRVIRDFEQVHSGDLYIQFSLISKSGSVTIEK